MKIFGNTALAATLLLASMQNAQALTPWQDGAPNLIVRISGAIAVTNAYTQVVNNVLATPNSVDTFNDVDPVTGTKGSRWTAHYFTGNANLGSALAGKKILLLRRTVGGSGYGVIPIHKGIPLEHLNIVSLVQADWQADGTRAWKQTISTANATKYLNRALSDGGSIAVEPSILLKPGTRNYPDQIPELETGLPEPGWPTDDASLPASTYTVLPTGGLVYGVAVTLDLYKALQAAQIRAGTLPSTTVIGRYDEASMPTLSRVLLASIISGKIGAWDQIKIVDKTAGNAVKSLTDPSILGDAGISAPYKEATTGSNFTPIALGLRNNGAATSVIAYSVFLNYPIVKNAFAPADVTPDSAVDEDASLPIVKAPTIVADTGTLLKDWQNGTNVLGFNNVADGLAFAKRWGIAINTADRNNSVSVTGTGGDPWRYIRVDGYAPTMENVAAGVYTYWSEGVVLYRSNLSSNKAKVLTTLANNLSSPSVVGAVSTTQAWGKTGAFATTIDPRGFTASIPFDASNPVSPFSHISGGKVHTEIVPVANPAAAGGLAVQMK